MEQANLKYYCYACQKYFHSATEVFSCLKCDSCAIELAGHSKQEKNNEEELSNFQVYEVKNETTQPQQVLGALQNNVRPRQRALRTMLGSSIQIIQGPQIRLNYDFSQNSYLFNMMRQLFGEGHIPQRATQQQINKLEKIQHVKQCSICQSVQQGQEQKEKEVKASEVSQGFKLKCNHTFHESCIKPWFERANTCPVCRTKLD